MTKEELIAMPLHSEEELNPRIDILRVVNGWVYTITTKVSVIDSNFKIIPKQITRQSIFVPEIK